MNCREAARGKQKLDELFKKVTSLPVEPEIQSHWARYLCVLVSGFLEVSLREILLEYSETKANLEVSNFVERKLDGFQNPNMTKILDLLGSFSKAWEENVRNASEGARKDAVNSVVENRHKIAHGESLSLTYSRISQYYLSVIEVIEHIDSLCLP